MPLSNIKTAQVNTIPITSFGGSFSFTFEMEENSTAQILWAQMSFTADAVIGNRRMVFVITDNNGNVVLNVPYFLTSAANATIGISYLQGNTVIPATVLGRQTAIPVNGVFVKNNWIFSLFPFPFISVGDIFTGHFQTKGLHNSEAPN